MRSIDLRNLDCPEPMFLAYREFGKMGQGEEVEFIMDNEVCAYNSYKLIKNTGNALVTIMTDYNGLYKLHVIKIKDFRTSIL
ncbi:putative redox protein, regulator of disulfide bond formation [Caldisphaera lagunensis DSM 15908]|uniref:Putative redox protein, regulator of disulfide bond formation n=1 Tax=Caldisphaera lagunensis (strain DSM 15908 / JCM 11604 / ANMR 0165 / IC-154) TaxID=1056495 RepID=L0ABW6_CALLD|nr:sulfurtransferase TusA family protein [Caldisphaera lagunensis]AFZ70540.1 putative redox protein, regulator of disulfide bond formation [Caldisphaera lagunensis DSM 15908]